MIYNKNQLIYRKHDIDKNMIYITALLKSITFLKGNDFTAIYNKKTENYIEYIRPECIKFTNSFLTNLDFEFAPKNKNITIYLENINKSSNSEERLKKYIEKASQEFISLSFKLDEMTTYYNGKIPNNLKIRQKYHFQSAEDFFIEKCKK